MIWNILLMNIFLRNVKNSDVKTCLNLLNSYVECIKFSFPKSIQHVLVQGY